MIWSKKSQIKYTLVQVVVNKAYHEYDNYFHHESKTKKKNDMIDFRS